MPLLLRSAGVKTYVYHWTRSLAAAAGARRLSLFPFLDKLGAFTHEFSILPPAETWKRLGLLHAANLCPYPILDWIVPECDVFHVSHQVQHPPRKVRLTSTIYDMTCWLMPELHSAGNVKASGRVAERTFRAADGLIAISECTRSDAVRLLGIRPEKIEVIYPGIAPEFFTAERAASLEVARRYGLTKPYVLFVGTLEPRKNLGMLLEAWEGLSREMRDEFDLAIAGSWGWGDRAIYERLRAGIPGVRYLGYVPERDLPALTSAATAFVYVSLYEGFGLPVGQAMAAGAPVVASGISSIPEVAGDSALLVDPNSASEIRSAMARLLGSQSLQDELSKRGRLRAREFTWEACAKKSWEFFERVAS